MSAKTRLGLLAACVAILAVAFIALRPSDEPDSASTSTSITATPTATSSPSAEADDEPTARPAPSPEPTPVPVPLLTTAKVTKIRVKKGDTVRFRARSSRDEEIHVHGYDLSREVAPGKTVRMTFKADIEGIFEIEFERSATPIAQLRVDPR